MQSPFERMAELAAACRPFAVATVVRTHGSTPQTIGARLIVTPDETERPFGTLGGGCVEADAILAAREALANGGRSLREYRLTEDLAWNSGLVCGGTMWILAERHDEATICGDRDVLGDLAAGASGATPVALVTRLARKGRRFEFDRRIAVRADGSLVGTLGSAAADSAAAAVTVAQLIQGPAQLVASEPYELLIEPVLPRPHVVIAGGGHVAKAIARQARLLEFDVTVLEDRPEFADPSRFDGASVQRGDVVDGIRSMSYGAQTYLIVATRGHKMDADCVLAAAQTNVRYIGLLGSRRKTVLIKELLEQHGVPSERVAVVHAPVGLDLGGRTPAEIALSVMAEITQVRHSGSGRQLKDR